MADSRLIEELKADFGAVRRPLPVDRALVLWWTASWIFVVAATVLMGPFRPDFSLQLRASPRFLVECLVGGAVTFAAARAALTLAVPGAATLLRGLAPALGLVAAWLGLNLYALSSPALEPSMVGKREYCFYETFAYSLAPMLALLVLLRRRAVLNRLWTGALAGLGAAAIPALVMQLACMVDPWHVLSHHLPPVALVAVLNAVLAWRFLARI